MTFDELFTEFERAFNECAKGVRRMKATADQNRRLSIAQQLEEPFERQRELRCKLAEYDEGKLLKESKALKAKKAASKGSRTKK